MTKKFFIDFIVGLYFPQKQEYPAPVQEVKTQEVKTEGYCSQFIPGKVYVKGTFKDIEANSNPELIKVIQRKGDYITVQAISYPDFTPIFKPERRKIHSHRLPVNYEHIALEGLDFDDNGNPKLDFVYSLCEYDAMFLTAPGYDVAFDETAYSPDYQPMPAVLDDVPENVSVAPEVLALSYVVVGDYSGINILDNGTHPCCERNSRPEIFVENMRRYFKLHPTKGSIQQLSGYTRFSANLELERRCIKDLLEDFCYYYPIKGKGLRKAKIIKNILDYAELHGLLKLDVLEDMPAPVIAEYDPDFDEDTWTPDYQHMPAVLDDVPEPRITDFREGRKVCSAFSGKDIISCKSRTELISLFSLAENRKTLISSFCSLGFDTTGLDKISSNRELAELLAWNIFISQTPKAKYVPPSVRTKKKSLAGRIASKSVKAIGALASVISSFFGL